MSIENESEVIDNEDVVDNGETEESVESNELEVLRLRNMELEAEAAKQRKIKQKIARERDELKSNQIKSSDDNDVKYKDLFEQTNAKLEAIQKKARDSEMKSLLTEKLTKAGVKPDALAAAVRLIDQDIIEFDEDEGIDGVSVDAAVLKLRGSESFLFEDKVKPTSIRQPATKTSQSNEISRREFDALSANEKGEKVRAGIKIVD